MGNDRFSLTLDEYEQGVVINALNDMRTKLIADNRETGFVDDVLVKAVNAPKKRFPFLKGGYYEAR